VPTSLPTNPRLGERLGEFEPREVRRILVGHYELRYEIQESIIYVLRLWHTRELRSLRQQDTPPFLLFPPFSQAGGKAQGRS